MSGGVEIVELGSVHVPVVQQTISHLGELQTVLHIDANVEENIRKLHIPANELLRSARMPGFTEPEEGSMWKRGS